MCPICQLPVTSFESRYKIDKGTHAGKYAHVQCCSTLMADPADTDGDGDGAEKTDAQALQRRRLGSLPKKPPRPPRPSLLPTGLRPLSAFLVFGAPRDGGSPAYALSALALSARFSSAWCCC